MTNALPRGAVSGPDFIVPDWPGPVGIHAAFTLRQGGVSRQPFDSFNIASHVGDEPAAVAENRARLRASLALPAEPLWLQQVHGNRVIDLDRQTTRDSAGPADAAVTRTAGRVCVVQVADC